MGTSTMPSAMEWRQPSLLPTTSSGDIYTFMYASMQAAQTTASKLRVVTTDKESSMNML